MTQQVVSPALRQWIVAQVAAGVDAPTVLAALQDSG